jgi:hypothetical protein
VIAIAPLAGVSGCGGGHQADDEETYDCALEDRDDTFVVGLEKTSPSGIRYQLMMSDPAPPGRGDNHMTVHLLSAAAAPMGGAALTVVPYMPDHGHGTAVPVVIVESTTVIGEYDVNPVNFHMPGLWQLIMRTSSAPADEVTFAFCVPG